jgi:hypothetical protein
MWTVVKRGAVAVVAAIALVLLTLIVLVQRGLQIVAGWFGLDVLSFALLLAGVNAGLDLLVPVINNGPGAVGPVTWGMGLLGIVVAVPLLAGVLWNWWITGRRILRPSPIA